MPSIHDMPSLRARAVRLDLDIARLRFEIHNDPVEIAGLDHAQRLRLVADCMLDDVEAAKIMNSPYIYEPNHG